MTMPRIDLSKTALERHDRATSRAMKKLKKRTPEQRVESKRMLEALLAEKATLGPIESATRNHPGLTWDETERMAHDRGF
jgi:hypothetical protein